MCTNEELCEVFRQAMSIDEEAHEVLLCHRGGYHSGSEAVYDMAVFEHGQITAQVTRDVSFGGERSHYYGTEYTDDDYFLYDDHDESHFFEDCFTTHLPRARCIDESAFDEILQERNVE